MVVTKKVGVPLLLALPLLSANVVAATIDVLVLYTPEAAQSTTSIDTKINQYIEASNAAYRDSGLDLTLRLAHSESIQIANTDGVSSDALGNFRASEKVNQLRAQYGADAAALISKAVPNGDGLITCGIGYIGQGANGQFHSYVKDIAYSMSAIDCGASTFTHELGHNLGLGHSRKQGSTGGVFEYGVGYGVQNSFTTIMAYDFVFNAQDVNKFSSPDLVCSGAACGIGANSTDSADAVSALKPVIQQFADFFPSSAVEPTPDPTPEPDPINPIPDNGLNLTENATFEAGVAPWLSSYGGEFSIDHQYRRTGEASLKVAARNFYYSGPLQEMTGKMLAGGEYRLSAWVRLAEGTDVFRFGIGIDEGAGLQYTVTDAAGVNADNWTLVEANVTLDAETDPQQVMLLAYGPAAEKDFYIDDIRVDTISEPEPEPEALNLVQNNGFEAGSTAFWEVGFGGKLFLSTLHAHTGTYSLASYSRSAWYHGVKQTVAVLEDGAIYEVSLAGRLHPNSSSTDKMIVYLNFKDDRGDNWVQVLNQTVNNADWTALETATATIQAQGNITASAIYVMSQNPASIFYVDDIVVTKK